MSKPLNSISCASGIRPVQNAAYGLMLAALFSSHSLASTSTNENQTFVSDGQVASAVHESAQTVAPMYAADSAQAWLKKMSSALNNLNYQISFVLLKPGVDSQPYLWRHARKPDGTEMEQLSLLNGPGREVVRINNKVSYFEPNVPPYSLSSSTINGPVPSEFFLDPVSLSAGYDFIMVGRSRVSGRAAQQIRIVSRDKSRFGFNLWLDQETGLLLKLNMSDLQGQLLEQLQVTELSVTEAPDPYFERIEVATLPDIVNIGRAADMDKKWQVNYLPVGMFEVKRDLHRLPITGSVVEYMMLSDGLVDISIYLQESGQGESQQDLLLRYQSDTLLTIQDGSLLVTVIGKLPPKTANAIANSIGAVQ